MTVIAIDGPSGSGKSTIARHIATATGLPYLDTGAMYRCVALTAMRANIDLADADLVTKCIDDMRLETMDDVQGDDFRQRVIMNGDDVSATIRTLEVSQGSSKIAVHPTVREKLVRMQRAWVSGRGGGVVEGRDIGSVVLPDADLKVFLTASEAQRAKRRQADAHAPEFANLSEEHAQAEIAKRDARDSQREASPLIATDDSFVLDTSDKTIDEAVQLILAELQRRTAGEA